MIMGLTSGKQDVHISVSVILAVSSIGIFERTHRQVCYSTLWSSCSCLALGSLDV